MNFIHKVLNIALHSMGLITLLFFLLSFLSFNSLFFILRSLLSEDVAGKVVLITGASSGIGEHLAYQYARRGACLVLVARKEKSIQEVADRARSLGSPEVLVIRADVSKVEVCKSFVDEAVEHFRRLDHLVNNAGITPVRMFKDSTDITNFVPVMDKLLGINL
ncbi:unnamed protein product, partial [Vitis vinifera]|uniref:11-beta-hydroxysteroid dehydrogenase-like 2 n=1 Tax=Vitis vinifera TaxID=29760 RepID=D7SH19_VITVI